MSKTLSCGCCEAINLKPRHSKRADSAEIDAIMKAETSRFYERLAAQQEPLGHEFAKVLNDSMHDLYIKD